MNNLEVFKDTQNLIKTNAILMQQTQNAILDTKIYEEGFASAKVPYYHSSHVTPQETLDFLRN